MVLETKFSEYAFWLQHSFIFNIRLKSLCNWNLLPFWRKNCRDFLESFSSMSSLPCYMFVQFLGSYSCRFFSLSLSSFGKFLKKPFRACYLTLFGKSLFLYGCLRKILFHLMHCIFWFHTPYDHHITVMHLYWSQSSWKIVVANNYFVIITWVGDIHITPTLILKNVPHVPKLFANLVSVQKLMRDFKCYGIFPFLLCFSSWGPNQTYLLYLFESFEET